MIKEFNKGDIVSVSKQLNIWKSEFGIEYTDRNIIVSESRLKAFKIMIDDLEINKILEIGCNVGHNLITLSKIGCFELIGIEPLKYAVLKGRLLSNLISILEGDVYKIPFIDGYFDLVFTCGVLIHISLKNLFKAIDEIYRASNKYILIIEYYEEKETPIKYRGYNNLLWKRNFKKHFIERHPDLQLLRSGFWDKENGFDRTHWWLFKK